MSPFDFILISLAAWRVAHLIAREPLFAPARAAVGVIHDYDGIPVGHTNFVAQGAQCVWCVSFWTAAGAILVYGALSPVFVWVLAVWAAATLVAAVVEALPRG